jgi:hypothetical protein
LIDLDNRPKEEPMDTSDAQASLGSDGIIESHPTSVLMIESTSTIEKSTTATTVQSPTQPKILVNILFFLRCKTLPINNLDFTDCKSFICIKSTSYE